MVANRKRLISADDLYRFELVTDCQLSPDGQHVVFAVQWVDREREKTYANLWIVPADRGRPRQFTQGDQVDTHPRWSPDGSEIAFLSNRRDEKQMQLYVIPFSGGEARQLTEMQGQFGNWEWSPDGRWLVCDFCQRDAAEIERETDERKKELGVVCRHVTRVFFKLNGRGFLPQERKHLWLIDALSGKARQLTAGDVHDEWAASWSPDGKEIVYCSNRSHDPDLEPDAVDLLLLPLDGGEPRRLETPLGPKDSPRFSPDGRWIAYLGREGRGCWWRHRGLWVVPANGSGPARNLTARFDLVVSNLTVNDLPGGLPENPPLWSRDGRHIFVQVSRHGCTTLAAVDVAGEAELETVIDGPGAVGACSFDAAQSRLAYLYGDMGNPGEVWVQDVAGGAPRQRSHVNTRLLQARELGQMEEVWFKGPDDNDLQGWILKPPDFDPTRRYPSILEIHGGPWVQYGNLFMHEFYFLAAHGYVVYFCNPRGGHGYGEAHARAITNRWGSVDYADLMAWADLLQQKPYVDPQRMGVTGGSYGGYMTTWIIGHTDRFRAAVVQRCVSNLISMYGSSDMNWSFEMEFGEEPPWENFANYWQQSPIKYIANATTPTLVIHSERDLRCAAEQGEQVFVALKRLGVDTELVLFPDESHELSRGGRTDRRVARLNHILRWFDRYLEEMPG
ncbi:MAG: S9 family peptidase [Anaerolineae bacterium]|nr:S9 family peptidase [Anaerolineae bacterium]